jgi:hypothetical protein
MNEYKKHILKRNVTAFLLSAAMLWLGCLGICLLILIGVLLGGYLPYVAISVLAFGLVYMISLPMRDYLDEKYKREFYINKAKKELLESKNVGSEQMRASYDIRKRDHLV